MLKTEFLPAFESMLKNQGLNIASPGAKDKGDQYFDRFKDLSEKQWFDLCEIAKDSIDRFPTRKQLCEIAASRGFFEASQANQVRPAPLSVVQCACGQSFAVREIDLNGINTFECPNVFYGSCNRRFESGYLKLAERAKNGVIYIGTEQVTERPIPKFWQEVGEGRED